MNHSPIDVESERLATLHVADIGDPKKFQPGSFGYHEALHVASMLADIVSTQLLNHPAILLDSDLYRRTHGIQVELLELYQAIGAKHFSNDDRSADGADHRHDQQ
ncbi:MAG: hypothetical protein J0H80_15980 [Rhizobiales bacterium]|nr:hypothetical protein [Hyphomicrobiales bacterium]